MNLSHAEMKDLNAEAVQLAATIKKNFEEFGGMRDCSWGQVCRLNYGKALRGYPEEPSEDKQIRVFGTNGPIGWTDTPLCQHAGIIIGRKGAYRGVHFSPNPFYVIDTAYYLELSNDEIDLKWAFYKLLTVDINRMDVGAAIPTTNRDEFYALKLRYPPKPIQIKSVQILSAYDELIENNRRRIQLLEQAARLLYKEWFIHLRFPGHEHVKIINGIPEGWSIQPLAELCLSIDYGYTASADMNEVGPKFLRITDIVPDCIDWSSVPYCRIAENQQAKFRLTDGDIVVARTGATVGYAKRLNKRFPESVFASYLVRLRLKPAADNLMIGTFMESDHYKNYVKSIVGGAAQPNANAKILSAVKILVPPQNIQRLFREYVEPIKDLCEISQIQNQKLRNTRDLLLPRLMSGEIAV